MAGLKEKHRRERKNLKEAKQKARQLAGYPQGQRAGADEPSVDQPSGRCERGDEPHW